ncbi:adenylate kinase [Bengtsoniella intestinalis]|uniref:adenylate kinase n=1 Tax=Bengtsoniella intestinalis TaxID=3073143 RepID=UPI00391EF9AB
MKLVLIGAPGAGKGTQARKLLQKYSLAYIATGDMLREEVAQKTDLGRQVEEIMHAGGLVSDHLIIQIVDHRIQKDDCKEGFILDGFPRTVVQAQELDKLVGTLDAAIYLQVEDAVLLERLCGRQTCSHCGATYHQITLPSKVSGICDECGHALMQRKDDTMEAGAVRLATFHSQSAPLEDYYREKNHLVTVNGLQDADAVFQDICQGIERL